MLDQATIAVIKSTIPLLESAGPALTQHFYQRMFNHNPELKDVFNLAHQRSGGQPLALFSAVAAYARNIDNLGALTGAVERIAHKHTGFLIQPEQYHIVGSHLLATLKEMGGSAVTDEVLEALAAEAETLTEHAGAEDAAHIHGRIDCMLASAGRTYVNRYGAAPGQRLGIPVF